MGFNGFLIGWHRPSMKTMDHLTIAVLIAIVVHLALILGVTFSAPKASRTNPSLEITLAQVKSAQAPKKADFLAQEHQQGSGSLKEKAAPKTDQKALCQDQKLHTVALPSATQQSVVSEQHQPKKVLAVQTPRQAKVAAPVQNPMPVSKQPEATFDSEDLSQAIASLEAEISEQRQSYAKRPRIQRLNAASTMRDKGAWYKDEWRKKVERVGSLNYPAQAKQQGIYGSLRLLVAINSDGSLHDVQILESSGKPVLDQAALNIVRLAAPFTPFSGDLREFDRLEIIRTWRFDRGDRLLSQ